jgi:hypothetical protein
MNAGFPFFVKSARPAYIGLVGFNRVREACFLPPGIDRMRNRL